MVESPLSYAEASWGLIGLRQAIYSIGETAAKTDRIAGADEENRWEKVMGSAEERVLRLRRSIQIEVCKHKQRFPDLALEKMIYNSQMQVKTDLRCYNCGQM